MANFLPEDYLRKPYSRNITPAEEGGFVGEIMEFPGCFAEGETPAETFEALERAAKSWIEAALDQGQSIPEPFNNEGFGGKVALRLPRSIHRQAVKMAERDSASLNQFLLAAISTRIGAEDVFDRIAERVEQRMFDKLNRLSVGIVIQTTNVQNNIDIIAAGVNFSRKIGTAQQSFPAAGTTETKEVGANG